LRQHENERACFDCGSSFCCDHLAFEFDFGRLVSIEERPPPIVPKSFNLPNCHADFGLGGSPVFEPMLARSRRNSFGAMASKSLLMDRPSPASRGHFYIAPLWTTH
jgi:hypothetical protein